MLLVKHLLHVNNVILGMELMHRELVLLVVICIVMIVLKIVFHVQIV